MSKAYHAQPKLLNIVTQKIKQVLDKIQRHLQDYKRRFAENTKFNVNVLQNWPALSLNFLNPIEHCWDYFFLFSLTSLPRLLHSYRDEPIGRWGETGVAPENHLTHPQAELGLSHMWPVRGSTWDYLKRRIRQTSNNEEEQAANAYRFFAICLLTKSGSFGCMWWAHTSKEK